MSLIPGAAIHGSGSYVIGEKRAAYRLLVLEAGAIGVVLLSGAGLGLTGASRYTVAPFALGAVGGVSLFTSTLLLDVYNATAPSAGFGVPRRTLPRLQSRLGYLYLDDPQFRHAHLLTHGVELRDREWLFGYQGWHAPEQGHFRWRADVGYSLWGVSAQAGAFADGSRSGVFVALDEQHYHDQHFEVLSGELQWKNRLDSERVVPDVHGAFLEADVGVALRHTAFLPIARGARTAGQNETLLLARTAFGVYLGDPTAIGGEFMLYYDHRHDDYAAGLKLEGLGSGVAGHLGASAFYYFTDHLGLESFAEVGSALVLGMNLRLREGGAW